MARMFSLKRKIKISLKHGAIRLAYGKNTENQKFFTRRRWAGYGEAERAGGKICMVAKGAASVPLFSMSLPPDAGGSDIENSGPKRGKSL